MNLRAIFQRIGRWLGGLAFNLFVWALLGVYFLPLIFMVCTALMSTEQLSDRNAPWYPAEIVRYSYQGQARQVFYVPVDDELHQWALVEPGTLRSQFVDPNRPEQGLIEWQGNWRQLKGVYVFSPVFSNFNTLLQNVDFPRMLGSTLLLVLIGEVGVLVSSTLVAYGLARFPLPGGNFLFYLLIATILIPEKVTFIPTFFMYVNFLQWKGTILPLVVHLFFGNAVYIFLLRQNFRSMPKELEDAAMLDGAGPLRRLVSIVLPQSWPVMVTIALLHFFYTWNESRLAGLYLSSTSFFMPISYGVQNYQSRVPIQNVIEAATLVVLAVPVLILLISQRFFMRGLIITGMEKK